MRERRRGRRDSHAGQPTRDIYDRSLRKFELIGGGVDRHRADANGVQYTTTVHWTITLRRVD